MQSPETPKQKNGCLATVFPYIFILIGLAILYFGFKNLSAAKESTQWPTAQGKIASSIVTEDTSSSGRNRSSSVTYGAAVRYEFTVDSTKYSGNTVSFGNYSSSDPSHAQGIVNAYPTGKTVTIYYKKSDPTQSVLEPGVKTQAYFMPLIGLIFFLVGLFVTGVHKLFMPKQPEISNDESAGPKVSVG